MAATAIVALDPSLTVAYDELSAANSCSMCHCFTVAARAGWGDLPGLGHHHAHPCHVILCHHRFGWSVKPLITGVLRFLLQSIQMEQSDCRRGRNSERSSWQPGMMHRPRLHPSLLPPHLRQRRQSPKRRSLSRLQPQLAMARR